MTLTGAVRVIENRTAPVVVYVAAWGRSGSTIVERALAQSDEAVAVGELHYLWERGLIQGRLCSCGTEAPLCPFWSEVVRHMTERGEWFRPQEVVALQQQGLRVRHTSGLARGRVRPAAMRYSRLLERLYRAISDVAGRPVIIDSTKRPSDLALLGYVDNVAVRAVHLTRHPSAVAYSWSRKKPHGDHNAPDFMPQLSSGRATALWLGWNGLIELAIRSAAIQSLRIRYEDFVADPAAVLNQVQEHVGVAEYRPNIDAESGALVHSVSGNPDRLASGPITIREDVQWRESQRVLDRVISRGLALPLSGRYGY